jgi:hypothetical protein
LVLWPNNEMPNTPRLIELKIKDVSQLFNSMDPSPFHEKDLDHDAEEFILSWAQEYPSKEPLQLKVYLEQWPSSDPTEMIKNAVHNYFSYRKDITLRDFKHLMRQGRTSLVIGSVFLGTCLLISNVIFVHSDSVWAHILKEGLTIAGWVALWRPIQIYLYDWWPVYNQIHMYDRLSHLTVEVVR